MAGVEHATHGLLVDTEPLGEGNAGQSAFVESEEKRGLGRSGGGDGDEVFSRASRARYPDTLGIVDASCNRLLECVRRFGQGFGFGGAGGQALQQVAMSWRSSSSVGGRAPLAAS